MSVPWLKREIVPEMRTVPPSSVTSIWAVVPARSMRPAA
jgi:hypothetical protein